MVRSKSPRLRRMIVIMKIKNRALTVLQKANKKYIVVTTRENKEVEVRFRDSPQPDSHQMCASFIFNHQSKRYFLYCKGKGDNPSLELKPEKTPVTSEKANLFKVTIDSERYKFQPYLNDGWFLSVSKNVLKLDNNYKNENTLFVLEQCGQSSPSTGEVAGPLEGDHTSSSCCRVSRQQRK